MNQGKIHQRMMERAHFEAGFATCDAAHVGCVLALDDLIVATGYNGAPRGVKHCTEAGCEITATFIETVWNDDRTDMRVVVHREYSRHVHAEANALCAAARHGRATLGTTCYVTIPPCADCAKLLLQAGIAEVIFDGTADENHAFANGGAAQLFFEGSLLAAHHIAETAWAIPCKS